MTTPENEAPPAATEGADYNSAGERGQAKAVPVDVQLHADPLTPPPGLVGELAAYFYDSARYQMKEGALLAALGLVAGVAGRNFKPEEVAMRPRRSNAWPPGVLITQMLAERLFPGESAVGKQFWLNVDWWTANAAMAQERWNRWMLRR